MAKKIQVELEAKTDDALNQVEALKKEIEDLKAKMAETSEKGGKGFKGLGKALKVATAPLRGATKGFKLLGKALGGLGVIGLLSKGFELLSEIFKKNQKVTDLFATAAESLSFVFNDLVKLFTDNISVVTDFFSALFTNPLETMKNFANTLQRAVIDRFIQLKETLGFVAKGIGDLFKGNFSDAMESFKQAGKEAVDVITGQDQSFEKVKETVTNYAKETLTAAKNIVELNKQAQLNEAINQGLIEKYDIQAEQLRQVRDDESKTFAERIEANEKLALVLDEQEKVMKANAQARIDAAEAELSKNEDNIEAQVAYQEALNELAGIEAQITGFRSEQQTNVNALLREQAEAKKEIAAIGLNEIQEERLEALNLYNERKALIEQTITDEEEKVAALKLIKDNYDAYIRSSDQAIAEEQKKVDEETQQAKIEMAKQTLGNISKAVGENTKAGKAAAAAAALINTYQGITAELATKTATPFGFALKLANIATTAAIGFKSVKDILKTDPKSTTGRSTTTPTSSGGRPAAEPLPPAFNIVGASGTNQLAEAIGGQAQQPVKAFVVSNDVSTAQELDRNIVEGASIG
tara:strand:- start:260 stop:2002 length:1743 start_codon:yes stop_codon:yes gene_type:complete